MTPHIIDDGFMPIEQLAKKATESRPQLTIADMMDLDDIPPLPKEKKSHKKKVQEYEWTVRPHTPATPLPQESQLITRVDPPEEGDVPIEVMNRMLGITPPPPPTPPTDLATIEQPPGMAMSARTTEPQYELIERGLTQQFETDNTIKSVSKELFSGKEVSLKSEVSHDEINDITRLHFLKEKFGVSNIDVLIQSLLELRVSKDRKSRREFVETVTAEKKSADGSNFLSRALGLGAPQNGGQK